MVNLTMRPRRRSLVLPRSLPSNNPNSVVVLNTITHQYNNQPLPSGRPQRKKRRRTNPY
jgi:hypothetical protein